MGQSYVVDTGVMHSQKEIPNRLNTMRAERANDFRQ